MNQSSMEGIVRLIRRVLLYSLIIEACSAVILMIRFAFDMPLGQAIYYGIFHAVSMFNNQHLSFTSKDGEEMHKGQRLMNRIAPFVDVVHLFGENQRGKF